MKSRQHQIKNHRALKARRKELRKHQTETEKLLWKKLRNRQLNNLKFFRQYSISFYVLDFYCPAIRLAIELDGGQHMREENRNYDQNRSSYLESMGVKILRFWNNEVFENLEGVLMKVIAECHNAP